MVARKLAKRLRGVKLAAALGAAATRLAGQDPAEVPPPGAAAPGPLAAAIPRSTVDEKALAGTIEELVACGTRHTLSSWDDPKRGIGCARNRILARYRGIAESSGARLEVFVDRFEASSARTFDKPARLENIVAILPGTDASISRTVFVVAGHYDSIPSSAMDSDTDAPGADDDASGVAAALEAARLLAPGRYRATLVFAALSGEEQGLLGGTRLLAFLGERGYTVGGFLDNDIVGADFAPGGPHRIRVFSGGGSDGVDSPSRDLAREAVRLVFRLDHLGRGGDHRPFVEAGLPAVRLTEPLENYAHEHQTPRQENGLEYGDRPGFLNYRFLGNVARVNADVLRALALAPAPPHDVTLSGGVTPDARISWSADADPERAGFEILWRETTDPRWSVCVFVPAAAETVLRAVSTDNRFFGVRSVGRNGARSVAVAAEPKPPPPKK
jgi:Peptidase family M28